MFKIPKIIIAVPGQPASCAVCHHLGINKTLYRFIRLFLPASAFGDSFTISSYCE